MPPDPRVLQAEKIVCLHMAQIRGGNPVTLIIGDKVHHHSFRYRQAIENQMRKAKGDLAIHFHHPTSISQSRGHLAGSR